MKELINYLPEITVTWSHKVLASQRPKIVRSSSAYELSKNLYGPGQIEYFEFFHVIFTNRANKALCSFKCSEGSVGASIVSPIKIFGAAVKCNASGIILIHNHPSGGLNPSQSDIEVTRKLQEGAKLLDMVIQDHIIITTEGYTSFADEGLL